LRRVIAVIGKLEPNTLPKCNTKAMAKMIILGKKEALKAAMMREEGLVIWMYESRLEDGRVGDAVVWKEGEEWKEERSYLGKKKEVFDAEVYAMLRARWKAMEIDNIEKVDKETIISHSTPAIKSVQNTESGPGQAMAITSVKFNNRLAEMGTQVEFRWVSLHKGVEQNEKAHQAA
jgi:ribonuclease HI